MFRFSFILRKEFLLLLRDRTSLALLFLMPSIFIVIMSLALQSGYASHSAVDIDYVLVDHARSDGSNAFIDRLGESRSFHRTDSSAPEGELARQVNADEIQFLLVLAKDFDTQLANGAPAATLQIGPSTDAPLAQLFQTWVVSHLSRHYLDQQVFPLLMLDDPTAEDPGANLEKLLEVSAVSSKEKGRYLPSSVQQNVPGWMLFGMFFVAIPLSNTLINERSNRTLRRQHSMGVTRLSIIGGKVIPYFIINLIQVILMLIVGTVLVPLLGGDKLSLGNSMAGLIMLTCACSLAAVSYALLISRFARTTEQATLFTGATNIIMAALGGIMIPRFLMPDLMQTLGWFSPMSWGLEGFHDLFLRDGGSGDVLQECSVLLVFAVIMLSLATFDARTKQEI
ncbi:MAG: ABC transporter permease [Gammaproteobacteria bacterium]